MDLYRSPGHSKTDNFQCEEVTKALCLHNVCTMWKNHWMINKMQKVNAVCFKTHAICALQVWPWL